MIGPTELSCGPDSDFEWRVEDAPVCEAVKTQTEEGSFTNAGSSYPTEDPGQATTSQVPVPTENALSCPSPPQVDNAQVRTSSERIAEYQCNDGYRAVGNLLSGRRLLLHCNSTVGEWLPGDFQCVGKLLCFGSSVSQHTQPSRYLRTGECPQLRSDHCVIHELHGLNTMLNQ